MKASLGLLIFILPMLAAAEVVVPIDKVENSVNIRLSADSATEIVGKLKQGESLVLVKSVPGWHEVEISGGATGFVSADWSVVLEAAPAPVVEAGPVEAVADDAPPVAPAEEAVADVPDVSADESSDETAEPVAESAEVEQVIAESEIATVPEVDAEIEVAVTDTVADVEADAVQNDPDSSPATESIETALTSEAVEGAVVETIADTTTETTDVAPTTEVVPVPVVVGAAGATGPQGPPGPQGPQGPSGDSTIKGSVDYLMKFTAPTIGGKSQIFDDGNNIGIGTTEPKQRLEVNGNIQIHEQNSGVAGLMITQSSGETGYIMHNRASTLTIGAGSIDRITIDREGNVGIGVSRPAHPMEMASGAHVSAGGVWTNSSSRAKKENIAELTPEEALRTLALLQPVQFNYKSDQQETYVGFIAEDVPELVATSDRTGLSAMDIVAVLTKVVQAQQQQIEELEARLDSGK
jgi:hypothetical protein